MNYNIKDEHNILFLKTELLKIKSLKLQKKKKIEI